MADFKKKKLGDLLKEAGLVTELQIMEAISMKKQDRKLGDLLVDQGYITEKRCRCTGNPIETGKCVLVSVSDRYVRSGADIKRFCTIEIIATDQKRA